MVQEKENNQLINHLTTNINIKLKRFSKLKLKNANYFHSIFIRNFPLFHYPIQSRNKEDLVDFHYRPFQLISLSPYCPISSKSPLSISIRTSSSSSSFRSSSSNLLSTSSSNQLNQNENNIKK